GQMEASPFAAGEVTDPLLLVAALEVEATQVGAGGYLVAADLENVVAVGDGFPHGFLVVQAFPALLHEGHIDGFTDIDSAGVRLLAAGDHAEQGGFAGAVAADDADD